ncbi:MAG: hypothetical protein AAF367_02745 [Pseudomonadota bacterium]
MTEHGFDPAGVERRTSLLDSIPDDDPDLRSDRSYYDRILDAYADMRSSTRAIILSKPSEGRLLFLALLSDVIFFLARCISMVVLPPEELRFELPTYIGLGLFLAFLFRTSLFYVFAMVAHVVSKPFGGAGTWYKTRCAVFWAALVSAPVEVFGAVVTVAVVTLREELPFLGADWLIEAPYFIGPIAFGFFLSAGVAEAQGFRYTYRVMAVLAILTIATIWGLLSIS